MSFQIVTNADQASDEIVTNDNRMDNGKMQITVQPPKWFNDANNDPPTTELVDTPTNYQSNVGGSPEDVASELKSGNTATESNPTQNPRQDLTSYVLILPLTT